MRIRLVFVPGERANLESLCPKTAPVMLAGMLRREGVAADVVDFGVLDSFERKSETDAAPAKTMTNWPYFWGHGDGCLAAEYGSAARAGTGGGSCRAEQYGRNLLDGSPAIIGWYVQTRDQFNSVKAMGNYVRRHAPNIHQTILGPYIARFGCCAMNHLPMVDTGITEDAATALAALCENIEIPESWGRIPGLLFRNRTGVVSPPRNIHPKRDGLPGALDMWSDFFRMPNRSGQFALYPVAFSNGGFSRCDYKTGTIRPLQKSVASVLDEMRVLKERCAAGAFHIDAPHVDGAVFERFADTLLANNFMTIYSLGGLTTPFGADLADRLFASGCRAVGFRAPSGSQRLLEDFYGCDMSISAIRATMRHCRAAGLFTVVHLQYPCPKDDYHTRAETELFLEACRPHGVCITPPELTPDSLWFMRPSEYGFIVNHRAFQQWASCAAANANKSPYRMAGWRSGRAEDARHSLRSAAEQLGCLAGVTERHGLLARIARSVMEESVFLTQLREALLQNDVDQIRRLMAFVNDTLDTLRFAGMATGLTAGAL